MQKDKNFLPHISYKNAAYIVQCSKHQWSQITSRVNLGVKCLNVNNIKRQISHTCVLDRILKSGSVGQHIILLFSLKGKKPHIRAHSEIADKTSSLLPVPLIPHIEKTRSGGLGGSSLKRKLSTAMNETWVTVPAQRVLVLQCSVLPAQPGDGTWDLRSGLSGPPR